MLAGAYPWLERAGRARYERRHSQTQRTSFCHTRVSGCAERIDVRRGQTLSCVQLIRNTTYTIPVRFCIYLKSFTSLRAQEKNRARYVTTRQTQKSNMIFLFKAIRDMCFISCVMRRMGKNQVKIKPKITPCANRTQFQNVTVQPWPTEA